MSSEPPPTLPDNITPLSGINPTTIPHHEFKSVEHVIDLIKSLPYPYPQQFLVFHSASPDLFKDLDEKRDRCVFERRHYAQTYYPSSQILIIRFPLNSHIRADRGFEGCIARAFPNSHPVIACGGTTWTLQNGVKKEANACWKPRGRKGRQDHPEGKGLPTVLLEVGSIASLERLRVDAAVWLNMGFGMVKTVLVFGIEEGSYMVVEKVVKKDDVVPTVVARIRIDVLSGGSSEEETVVQLDSKAPVALQIYGNKYRVTGAPLVLKNEELFRDIGERSGDFQFPEGDAVFGDEILAELASVALRDI